MGAPCIDFYYGYDYRGRLTSVSNNGNIKESYEYNYTGALTRKSFQHSDSSPPKTTHTWFLGPDYEVRQSTADASLFAKTLSIGGIANYTYGNLIDGQASIATVENARGHAFRRGHEFGGSPR